MWQIAGADVFVVSYLLFDGGDVRFKPRQTGLGLSQHSLVRFGLIRVILP